MLRIVSVVRKLSRFMSTNAIEIKGFFETSTSTAQYVIADPQTKSCAIVDSVLGFDIITGKTTTTAVDEIAAFVKEQNYDVKYILETHAHADHLSGAQALKKIFGAPVCIGAGIIHVQTHFKKVFNLEDEFQCDGSQFDHLWQDGEEFQIGKLPVRVLHTPGHTPACVTYAVDNQALFLGDTIFMPDFGSARCDFPGGSASNLYKSIRRLYNEFSDNVRVFVGHDYAPGGRAVAWETTVGDLKNKSIHVKHETGEEEFVKLRTTKDATLGFPKLLLPALQINIRAGKFPPPEKNGVSYMKIPLNSAM